MGERAQSELVGFVLIFGIMLLVLLLVMATGFVGLHAAQDHHRTSNIQPAFTVLGDNLEDIVHHGAPSRATEIKLSDATLDLNESFTVTVEADNATHTFTAYAIEYDSGTDTQYRYENGLILRVDDGSTVLVREPNIEFGDDSIVFPIVELSPSGTERVGGSTTVLLNLRHEETAFVYEDAEEVTIEVSSDHPEVWHEFLDSEAGENCTVTGTTVVCESTRIYLPAHRIGVSFD